MQKKRELIELWDRSMHGEYFFMNMKKFKTELNRFYWLMHPIRAVRFNDLSAKKEKQNPVFTCHALLISQVKKKTWLKYNLNKVRKNIRFFKHSVACNINKMANFPITFGDFFFSYSLIMGPLQKYVEKMHLWGYYHCRMKVIRKLVHRKFSFFFFV